MDTFNKSPRGTKIYEELLRTAAYSLEPEIAEPIALLLAHHTLDFCDTISTKTNYGCALPNIPYAGYFGLLNSKAILEWISLYGPIIYNLHNKKVTSTAGTSGFSKPSMGVVKGSATRAEHIWPLLWYPVYLEVVRQEKNSCMCVSIDLPITIKGQKIQYKKGFYYLKRPNEIKISRVVATHRTTVIKKQINLLLKEAHSLFMAYNQ